MGEQSAEATARVADHAAAELVVIGRGTHATITLDPSSKIVCKQFHLPDQDAAADLTRREFDYLRRFSAAVSSEQYVSCPEPLGVHPDRGRVWMTHCSGAPLEKSLAKQNPEIDSHLDHIVEQISTSVELYLREFDEPYFDLATKNMLYDVPSRTLSLVDFSSNRRVRHQSSPATPLEISLACLIGLSTYESVRPSNCRNTTYWRRLEAISVGVLERLQGSNELRPALIQEESAAIFDHSGKRGKFTRRLWYSTIGQMLYRRRSSGIFSREGSHP